MTLTAGFDVGGAHLKVALLDAGRPVAVEAFACPLWLGLDRLDAALIAARPLVARARSHAVTMTGELSDLFQSRAEGVAVLTTRLQSELGADTRFWLGRRGFGSGEDARAHPADAGSTNYAATAHAVSARIGTALLVDMGSTTTDIIAICDGAPHITGWTDAQRLACGELVYTGLTRTSVMAVAQRAPFAGLWQGLTREHLATMADVRRVLSQLPDGIDLHATADGRGTSVPESVARLARLFGRDASEAPTAAWTDAARYFAAVQVVSILDGCRQVLSAHPLGPPYPVIAAGIGAGVIADVAASLAAAYTTFGDLLGASGPLGQAVTHHAAAVAVARLANPAFEE